jgi:hypothetical protein
MKEREGPPNGYGTCCIDYGSRKHIEIVGGSQPGAPHTLGVGREKRGSCGWLYV